MEQGCSRTRACRVCNLSRSSSRTPPKERNPQLRDRVVDLAHEHPRFGFRRIHLLLPGTNVKAVHRIWKKEGLRIKRRSRKRLKGQKKEAQTYTAPNQAWCLDFCHERLENGRSVRILGILDCCTRENLLLKASHSFPSFQVQSELEWLFLVHGKPACLVSDNGPEFRALELTEGVESAFIQPGKPWQNGYIESFFGKLRDELLSCELFTCGSELQNRLDEFRDHYNTFRPHLGLGGLTPLNFREGLQANKEKETALALNPG